jgi:hypothetical protein
MLVQVVVALIAAGGVLMFSLRRRISSFFAKKDNKKAEISKNAEPAGEDMADRVIDAIDEWDESQRA